MPTVDASYSHSHFRLPELFHLHMDSLDFAIERASLHPAVR